MPTKSFSFALLTLFFFCLVSCEPENGDDNNSNGSSEITIPFNADLNFAARLNDDSVMIVTSLDSIFKISNKGAGRTYTGENALGFTYFSTDNRSVVMVNPGGNLMRVNSDLTSVNRDFGKGNIKNYRLYHNKVKNTITLLGYDCLNIDYNFSNSTPGFVPKIITPDQPGNPDVLGFAIGDSSEYIYYGLNGSYFVAAGTFDKTFNKVIQVTKKTSPYLVKAVNSVLLQNTVIVGTKSFTQSLLENNETYISCQIKMKSGDLAVIISGVDYVEIKKIIEGNNSVSLSAPVFTLNTTSFKFLSFDGNTIAYQNKTTRSLILKTI